MQCDVQVTRYPTKLMIQCPQCRHMGMIAIFLEHVDKLKCSRCGNRNPIVQNREPLRRWAKQRRTR